MTSDTGHRHGRRRRFAVRSLGLLVVLTAIASLTVGAATAAIDFGSESHNANSSSGSSSLVITKPASVANNNVLIAGISVHGSDVSITKPSGWTLIRRTNDSDNDLGFASYYHVVTNAASEPASYTWTFDDSDTKASGGILRYTGVDTVNPIDTSSGNNGESSSAKAKSITTATANERVIGFFSLEYKGSFTPPSGMNEHFDISNSDSRGPTTETADFAQATATATGDKTAAASKSEEWAAQLIALRGGSGPLDHFKVEAAAGGNIGTQTVGVPFNIKVTAQDSTNQTVTGFTGTVNMTSNRTCTAGCTTTASFVNGVLTSWTVKLTQAGTLSTMTATKTGGSENGISNQFTVVAGALHHIVISPDPATIAAGGSQAYTAQGFDEFGNSKGDVTAATTFSIGPNGSCTGATCTATIAGDHTVTGNDSGKTDTATLHVTAAAALHHIVISPDPATITAGGSQAYTAEGFDQYGNSKGDVTAATTFSISGTNSSCTGAVCTSTLKGAHTVTGNDSGKTDTATLNVNAAALHHIVISPHDATITAGGSQAYTAEGFDQYGNSKGDVTAATTFSIGPNGSCTGATCTANTAGDHTVTGNDSGKTDTATLHVNAGSLDHIVISPDGATIAAGGSQAYTAEGFDQYGNSKGDVTGATTFSITNGTCTGASCTSTVKGDQTVTGNDSGKTDDATLHVTAAALDHIVISPDPATIAAGGSQAYTAEGFDQYGNSKGDVTADTTFSIGPDGSCTGASCGSTTVGDHTVTGNDSGKTDDATLHINAGALDHIVISPDNATITAGDSQAYTAEGFDQYGNSKGDVTGDTTFSIGPDGSCTGNSCTTNTAGDHTVTGNDSGKTDDATLHVNAGALDHIVISPDPATITAGGSQAYTAEGVDQYGNSKGDVTADTTFSIGPDGSCTGASCTATGAGDHTVTGNDSGKTDDATLHVVHGPFDHYKIDSIPMQQATVSFNFVVTAQDQYNNTVTSYGGTVDVTSTLPIQGGPFQSGPFTSGVLTQGITLTVGAQSANITAAEHGGSYTKTSNNFRVVEADGDGTMTVAPINARGGANGNSLVFTYTPAAGGAVNGFVTVDVPSGWSAPSTNHLDPGYVTASGGTLSVSGNTINVQMVDRKGGNPLLITYGDIIGGGPGALAPSTGGMQTWLSKSQGRLSSSLVALASSPSVNVLAIDGSGTLTVSPDSAVKASTGNTLTFTYTAAAGGILNGQVTINIPNGWSQNSQTSGDPGYTTASQGTVTGNANINVSGITLNGGDSMTITYGNKSGGGPGASAPPFTGAQTWNATEKSAYGGNLTPLATSPVVTITQLPVDHFSVQPVSGVQFATQQKGQPFSFKVTALDSTNHVVTEFDGPGSTVDVTSNTPIAGGSFTSGTFTNGVLASTPLTLTDGNQAATITVTQTGFSGTGTSAAIRVTQADGEGTLTVAPTFVRPGSNGNTLNFTYTPAAGGVVNGAVTITVPSDWPAPSVTGSAQGFVTTSAGTVSVSGDTITVSLANRAGGSPMTIKYGATTSGGPGATAPSTGGSETWLGKSQGIGSGSLQPLAPSPSVLVLAADGSGTMSPSPTSVVHSSTGNTITFTYTAAAGGMQGGTVSLAVPSGGWSAPSLTSTAAGYVTSSQGTVAVAGSTITVSALTLNGGDTFTITYGDKSGGGSGATAASALTTQTWTTKQRSSSGGALTNLAVQPTISTT